jgi:hypothetical protein
MYDPSEWFDSWSHNSFLGLQPNPKKNRRNVLVVIPGFERDAPRIELALVVDDNLLALFTNDYQSALLLPSYSPSLVEPQEKSSMRQNE